MTNQDQDRELMRRLVREFVCVVETREEFDRKEHEFAADRAKLINGNGHDEPRLITGKMDEE
jgi:hypothetical protein